MGERSYLDWNATAPLRAEARAAFVAAQETTGNASSIHAEGRAARRLIEEARGAVAGLVGAKPGHVVFTSGGTEANALALSPAIIAGNGEPIRRLLVSAVEHPSVLSGGRFPPAAVEQIPVTASGIVDVAALDQRLAELATRNERALVSVMLANNESGVVQPIAEVADAVRRAGGLLHVDAVQAIGRIACDINELGADLITLSGHKIGAPKGTGALVKRDEALHLDPVLAGGGQERGARAGTENVAGIAGFGAAAEAVRASLVSEAARMRRMRERLETGIAAVTPQAVVFGSASERLPNTTLFAVAGMKAETAVIAFDLEGVAVSSGAACSSGKVQPSHVLGAMGVSPLLAGAAVRVSLGGATKEADIDRFLEAWIRVSGALLKKRGDIAA